MALERIVSLVPSLTELVCWLGAADRLVGRTRFCVEPAGWIDSVPVVGGTKNPSIERIAALAPDLVIANKEENRREDVEALRAMGLHVLLTDPASVSEAVATVRQLGSLLGCSGRAEDLATETEDALSQAQSMPVTRVFVAIWKTPLMCLGRGTYGHDLVEWCGGVNIMQRPRYPEVTLDEVRALRPDLVLLPDEPYPFSESDRETFSSMAEAKLVDGRLLWWYGPRMPVSIRALRRMLAGGSP